MGQYSTGADTHDQERADELSRWINRVRSGPVLQPGRLITRGKTQHPSARLPYCDKTSYRQLERKSALELAEEMSVNWRLF